MDFLKQYGGWIIVGLLSAVILYLVFRPVYSPDNSAALKVIDSLTKENNALRETLRGSYTKERIKVDSLARVSDSLQVKNDLYKARVIFANQTNISLAHQIIYYKEHNDPVAYDSACDILASRVIQDSVTIKGYVLNTDRLIWTMGETAKEKDSIIRAQAVVIYSDSVVQNRQQSLIVAQQKEIKRSVKDGKITAWLARGFAVATGILAIVVATK